MKRTTRKMFVEEMAPNKAVPKEHEKRVKEDRLPTKRIALKWDMSFQSTEVREQME